jgi:glycerol-3-phosphate dehydrogenase
LNFVSEKLSITYKFDHKSQCFIPPKPEGNLNPSDPKWVMMAGRLGADVNAFFERSDPAQLERINPLPELWAELTWAAQNEAVVHLDDLLLRRVRLGVLMPSGGLAFIDRVRELVQEPLGWSDEVWDLELARYKQIWRENYYLPLK